MDEYRDDLNYTQPQGEENTFEPELDQKKKKKKRVGVKVTALVLSSVLFGTAIGVGAMQIVWRTRKHSEPEVPKYQLEEIPVQDTLTTAVGDKSLTPADVYANNVNAVVGISTESTPTTNIFGQISATTSTGSGFVLTEDGYVVTNYHVVENAKTIKVTLFSGETYPAKFVGGYSDNDVALLKIEQTGLPHVTVGKSSELVVGEMVVAIGNPLGELTYTMTVGYISAMDREINASGKPINMLQTDVAINSGNSGGPIFDMNGNVVAIASAKYSGQTSSGTFIEGLSFAIPIDDVLDIIYDLGTYGYVTGRPYLGVTLADLDSATANTYGLPVGPIVQTVDEGSCAEKAGIVKGDIILALGDKEVSSYNDLVSAMRKFKAGDSTTITVFRSGERKTLNIVFDEKATQPVTETMVTETPTETVPPENYYVSPFDFFFGGR